MGDDKGQFEKDFYNLHNCILQIYIAVKVECLEEKLTDLFEISDEDWKVAVADAHTNFMHNFTKCTTLIDYPKKTKLTGSFAFIVGLKSRETVIINIKKHL